MRILIMAVCLFITSSVLANPVTYEVDGSHAYAIFAIDHKGIAPNYGRFNTIKGTLVYGTDPSRNSIKLNIDPSSVDTGHKKRDKHLRGPDFFDTKQFPNMTFVSKKWKKAGPKTYKVTGDLSFHGVTKSMTVQVEKTGAGTDRRGNDRVGLVTHFEIDRTAFGVNYSPKGLGRIVKVTLSMETVHKN